MLYYLFSYLETIHFPGARVFTYVTFRAAMAIILALIVSVWFGNFFIKLLKRKSIVETQRDAETDPYNTQKKGVPTMGGVIIITALLIPVLLVCKLHSIYTILMMRDGFIAPNINFETPDQYSEGLNIINKPTACELNVCLSNSFGFGGTNSALVIKKL